MVQVRELKENPQVLKEGHKTIAMIDAFKHGVHATNEELGIPDVSINLAIMTTDEKGGLLVETSAQSDGMQKN